MVDTGKIKSLRVKLGLSQQQAADAAGMGGGRQQWGDLELGRKTPTLDTLARVASALGVEPADLLVKTTKK